MYNLLECLKFSVVLFFSNWQHITSLPHKGAMSVVSKYMVISIYQNKWAITVSHCFSLDHVVFTVSLNCLEWICGLSSTRWSVLDVGLGTDPAATTMTNATPQKSCSIWSQSSILREVCVDTNCSVENVAMTPGATWRERITSHRTCFCFHSSSSEHVGHVSGSWCFFIICRLCRPCRWICHCVPGADEPRGALRPEEDVRQQRARSAGVQTWDSNNGEWVAGATRCYLPFLSLSPRVCVCGFTLTTRRPRRNERLNVSGGCLLTTE